MGLGPRHLLDQVRRKFSQKINGLHVMTTIFVVVEWFEWFILVMVISPKPSMTKVKVSTK